MIGLVPHDVFFLNDTAPTEIYTLSLHDALPICGRPWMEHGRRIYAYDPVSREMIVGINTDRKSTRLNSSHANISYAVFCLKKKKKKTQKMTQSEQTVSRAIDGATR